MTKFDYSNGIVDRKDRKRLYFFEEITDILVMLDSTNDEVNELIYWLYSLSRSVSYREYKIRKSKKKYKLKKDRQVDENTFIRNVWNNDMFIYCIILSIHDYSSWCTRDTLTEIVDRIYWIMDEVVHPNYRPGLDLEDTRYYVEVEYISKEKQKEIKEKHNMDFEKENWRA